MESCEGATGLPKESQRWAKTEGCLAFRQGRVYLMDLLRWIFKATGEGRVNWRGVLIETRAKIAQIELDTTRGNLIARTTALQVLQSLLAIHFEGYERLAQELPASLAGKNAAQVRAELVRYISEIKSAEQSTVAGLKKQPARKAEKEKETAP